MTRALLIVVLSATPLAAQWIQFKDPSIPRTKDGKPKLSAPPPRAANGKPDLALLESVGLS